METPTEITLHERAHRRIWALSERIGQAYFNAAYEMDQEWADKMRGTLDDPFHKDENLAEFLTLWKDEH